MEIFQKLLLSIAFRAKATFEKITTRLKCDWSFFKDKRVALQSFCPTSMLHGRNSLLGNVSVMTGSWLEKTEHKYLCG